MNLQELVDIYSQQIRSAGDERRFMDVVKILDQFRAELRASPPDEKEVLELLRVARNCKTPSVSQYGFIAAWSNLSTEYVPVLCEIVHNEECRDLHEPAIEILGELADDRAFDALKKAVSYRWEYDQWYHVPRKALLGLLRIGGEDAIGIIIDAANSSIEEIRTEASELLMELNK